MYVCMYMYINTLHAHMYACARMRTHMRAQKSHKHTRYDLHKSSNYAKSTWQLFVLISTDGNTPELICFEISFSINYSYNLLL